jgi:tetratricopeptide (TPR) repeat protein
MRVVTQRGRVGALLFVLCGAVALAAAAPDRTDASRPAGLVRAWEDSIVLPTYDMGQPDPNAPFDVFLTSRFSYPYTLLNQPTATRSPRRWRTLNLENEYLRCSVLPDLGGHLYTCTDKMNGHDLFYANTSLKFANVAYRGAWAAYGIEFNFPVSHNWMTVSPVDSALMHLPDGSASVWVGNTDRVYGGQWRVALTLRPHRAVLEQHTSLYNGTPVRHRFYWWTNAAVRVNDDSRMLYPMRFTASHGFREVDTWPIDHRGVDLSTIRTHTEGPVSLFSHGSREGYMGVYDPDTNSGVVHYSPPSDLPAKKFWSWGVNQDAKDWRIALSDDQSAYVEIQAGLFRNQETYAFLEPQETIAFDEYWLPIRGTGGFVRATPDAVLNLTRAAQDPTASLTAAITVTRPIVQGHLRLLDGVTVVKDEPIAATPATVVRRTYEHPSCNPCTVELRDRSGVLVRHTENEFDWTPANEIHTGPQPVVSFPPAASRSESDVLAAGRVDELEGRRLVAYRGYIDGLERFPDSFGLHKAAGRLAVQLQRADEAITHLTKAASLVTTDAEVEYYLGDAYVLSHDDSRARAWLERAQRRSSFRVAARLALAELDTRSGNLAEAARTLDALAREAPDAIRIGVAEVAVLRHSGRLTEARKRLTAWRAHDPTSSALRLEAVLLGVPDPQLWVHFAADPNRLLEAAAGFMSLGFFDDAVALLSRKLPDGPEVISEPGTPRASSNPLIAYYRGYCRKAAGGNGGEDFAAASRMPITYVFPSRADSEAVLKAALAADPADATASYLLGSLYLSRGTIDRALDTWTPLVKAHARIPGLHRNVGLTELLVRHSPERAAPVLAEGLDVDPTNVGLYVALDQTLSVLGRPAAERAAMLRRYPAASTLPTGLAFKLALALAEAGKFDDAEQVFANRFFAREEGGTNVREVYLEVRRLRAVDAARSSRCDEALQIADGLANPVEGLPFTRDGLGVFLARPRVQLGLADVFAQCGRKSDAHTIWTRLSESQRLSPAETGYAYQSALSLCSGTRADACRADIDLTWMPRLQHALQSIAPRLEDDDANPSGLVQCAAGQLLAALGRTNEAREHFRAALMAPDRLLSHHIARTGLAELASQAAPAR